MARKRKRKKPQPSAARTAPTAKPPRPPKSGRTPPKSGRKPPQMEWHAALLANLVVFVILLFAAILESADSDLYYRTMQEDEWLEWGTFWAFMIAAGVFVFAALRQRRATRQLPWFLLGVGAFCFVVAMEEISWAQRVFGYRPPAYFLEHNFQQELNVHNVMSTSNRKLTLKAIIVGYGCLLPFLVWVPEIRRLMARYAVVVSPLALVPSFAVTYLLYESYPWDFSGEVVELMLGACFLFAGTHAAQAFRGELSPVLWRRLAPLAAGTLAFFALGLANAAVSQAQKSSNPQVVETALTEAEALKRDFLALRRGTKCGTHKRVYSWVEKYDGDALFEGQFAALTAQGLPEDRADFFIDPWNSPYWIRHKCDSDDDRVAVFVYSFGPNRRRDSNPWEIVEDDVGIVIESSNP